MRNLIFIWAGALLATIVVMLTLHQVGGGYVTEQQCARLLSYSNAIQYQETLLKKSREVSKDIGSTYTESLDISKLPSKDWAKREVSKIIASIEGLQTIQQRMADNWGRGASLGAVLERCSK